MSESLYGKTVQQLIAQGWTVLTDEYSNSLVGVRSVIRYWNSMTWAERTYYGAKYGFDQRGVLDIRVSQQTRRSTSSRRSWDPALRNEIVVPENRQLGSNERLRTLLAQNRVAVERSRYDDTGLAHFGPDGTAIVTTEYLWGLQYLNSDGRIDLDERHTCNWEDSSATWCPDAPWWAVGPDAEELERLP